MARKKEKEGAVELLDRLELAVEREFEGDSVALQRISQLRVRFGLLNPALRRLALTKPRREARRIRTARRHNAYTPLVSSITVGDV